MNFNISEKKKKILLIIVVVAAIEFSGYEYQHVVLVNKSFDRLF